LEFAPGGLELALGALVVHSIQTRVLDQNIEAVKERPSRRAAAGISWSGVSDNSLLAVDIECPALRLSGKVT
jgi:hypothetical protein